MKNNSVRERSMTKRRTTEADPARDTALDGFFEISKIVDSPEMLQGWVEWFRRLNIPCVIEKRKAGYALWRKGDEAGRDRSKGPSAPKPRNVVYSSAL
jgi:hypothetical protein